MTWGGGIVDIDDFVLILLGALGLMGILVALIGLTVEILEYCALRLRTPKQERQRRERIAKQMERVRQINPKIDRSL